MRIQKCLIVATALLCASLLSAQPAKTPAGSGLKLVTINSPSALYNIQILFYAGSANDSTGKEGTANLVANALSEGGFGDPKNAVTKEKVAEITLPWGDAAAPSVLLDKQTITISMTVPRDAFPEFVQVILKP